jgi:Protein of unknown function (DUF2865)
MRFFRSFGPALWVLGIALTAALAQPAPPAGPSNQSPVCARLESQLSGLDRGITDPARAEQVRRYEEAASKQQAELDQLTARSRRMGCEGGGFFALFTGQPPQCGPLNSQIQQMRANLDRMLMDIQRLQGGSADREGQRRAILVALAQNDCGPQYRQAAQQPSGGFFDQLFGPGGFTPGDPLQSSTFRTICVRTCDGFYFPVSYSTNPSRFADDENACRRLCPAAEVALYSHRNPGEDVRQAVSTSGRLYTELPNAFRYRQAYDPSCTCKRPGQSWSEALDGRDNTVERGDIVVTEDRAKALSQPPPPRDAQGRPVRQDTRKPDGKTSPTPAEPAAAVAEKEPESGKRNVRNVGPTFLPPR